MIFISYQILEVILRNYFLAIFISDDLLCFLNCSRKGLGIIIIINIIIIIIIMILLKVSVDTINFIWTGRSIGFMITSVLTAVVFKQYCR